MDLHEIFREGWANEQMIKFWWHPDRRRDRRIVFQIRHCWEIRKVVINRHKSAAHIESPDGGTGKTPLAEVCTDPVLLLYRFEFGLLFSLNQPSP